MIFKYQKQYSVNVVIPALVVAFILGLFVRFGISPSNSSINSVATSTQISSAEFAPFWKAWDLLDSKHVESASTTSDKKVWGAIKGLASSYNDPYTVFFPPAESKIFNENIEGNFSGVGMEIGIKNGALTVVTPIKGSPAEKAGVKSGDIIVTINGTSTADMSVDEAVSYIRGPRGSEVKILFLPKNATKTIERKLIRDVINVPTLDTEEKPGGVFVIKLYGFTGQATGLFREALRKFVMTGDHKLVLDLRGNPGGYLDSAVDIASWFLPSGTTVVSEDFGTKHDPVVYRSSLGKYLFANTDLKMIILADGGSASASEILAGALQENGVAKIVGAKTFGKGVVQELIPLTDDTSLKVTVARWLTPKGHNLSHDGLEPDYPVTVTEKDVTAEIDAQMNKALELLK